METNRLADVSAMHTALMVAYGNTESHYYIIWRSPCSRIVRAYPIFFYKQKNSLQKQTVFLVETNRLELSTSCMSSKRSDQLGYASILFPTQVRKRFFAVFRFLYDEQKVMTIFLTDRR